LSSLEEARDQPGRWSIIAPSWTAVTANGSRRWRISGFRVAALRDRAGAGKGVDMQTSLVLTVIGPDRPGIVEQLSDQVLAVGGNWEESRMARLGGKFVGLLRVSVDAALADRLADGLRGLVAENLIVVVEHSSEIDVRDSRMLRLDLVGGDRPGIVRDISQVLARHGVNIEELETEVESAAMSGEPIFHARARVRLPGSTTVDEIRAVLEAMADHLMVDLAFDEGTNAEYEVRQYGSTGKAR
jgi:glycine cleavage system regulatory protein